MKSLLSALALLSACACAHAQSYSFRIDPAYRDEPLKDLIFLQAESPIVDVITYVGGTLYTNLTDQRVEFSYGTGAVASAFVTLTNESVLAAQGIFRFNVPASALNTNGTFWYTALWYIESTTNTIYSGKGTMEIEETTVTGNPGSPTLLTPFNINFLSPITGVWPAENLPASSAGLQDVLDNDPVLEVIGDQKRITWTDHETFTNSFGSDGENLSFEMTSGRNVTIFGENVDLLVDRISIGTLDLDGFASLSNHVENILVSGVRGIVVTNSAGQEVASLTSSGSAGHFSVGQSGSPTITANGATGDLDVGNNLNVAGEIIANGGIDAHSSTVNFGTLQSSGRAMWQEVLFAYPDADVDPGNSFAEVAMTDKPVEVTTYGAFDLSTDRWTFNSTGAGHTFTVTGWITAEDGGASARYAAQYYIGGTNYVGGGVDGGDGQTLTLAGYTFTATNNMQVSLQVRDATPGSIAPYWGGDGGDGRVPWPTGLRMWFVQ